MARILVIDDDANIRYTLRQMLTHAGHEVLEAPDGADGLRIFRQQRPDLVITDIFMPERDGLEVILALKREFPTMKIIAISGGGQYSDVEYLTISKKLGADLMLRKPFSRRDVLAALQKVCARCEAFG
jgi:CheY-like chemotaxis protein